MAKFKTYATPRQYDMATRTFRANAKSAKTMLLSFDQLVAIIHGYNAGLTTHQLKKNPILKSFSVGQLYGYIYIYRAGGFNQAIRDTARKLGYNPDKLLSYEVEQNGWTLYRRESLHWQSKTVGNTVKTTEWVNPTPEHHLIKDVRYYGGGIMNETTKNMMEMEIFSKQIQLDLAKGELKWEDDTVQFFIPVALALTDFDWLNLIAEHNLIEEDCKIVKNFLAMASALAKFNGERLTEDVKDKLRRLSDGKD